MEDFFSSSKLQAPLAFSSTASPPRKLSTTRSKNQFKFELKEKVHLTNSIFDVQNIHIPVTQFLEGQVVTTKVSFDVISCKEGVIYFIPPTTASQEERKLRPYSLNDGDMADKPDSQIPSFSLNLKLRFQCAKVGKFNLHGCGQGQFSLVVFTFEGYALAFSDFKFDISGEQQMVHFYQEFLN